MDGSLPVTHLASAVWIEINPKMKPPMQPVDKSSIEKNKEQIYRRVAGVCNAVVATARKKLAMDKSKVV